MVIQSVMLGFVHSLINILSHRAYLKSDGTSELALKGQDSYR